MIAAAERLRSPFLRFSLVLHFVGLVVVLLFPQLWKWVVGCLVADHLVALFGSLVPRSSLVGPNLRRVPTAANAPAFVVLTLDDGPDPDITPRVLDILEHHGATATFFCIGRRVAAHPELTRRIAAAGHRVENHTYGHSNLFSFFSPWALTRELQRAQEAIASNTGSTPRFFRAPAGVRSPWLDWVLAGAELELVSWTRRAFDTVDGNPQRIVRRLLRNLATGDVLALHDAGSARAADGEPVILHVLPELLAELGQRGLRVTPLPRATASEAVLGTPVSA